MRSQPYLGRPDVPNASGRLPPSGGRDDVQFLSATLSAISDFFHVYVTVKTCRPVVQLPTSLCM
jgi:hypothetical protein